MSKNDDESPARDTTSNVNQGKAHQLLCYSELKAKTEGFILAEQDQCLPTRYYEVNVLHIGAVPKCWLCNEKIEIIDRIMGSQVGVVVISRASHLYDPGSSPHVG